MKRKSILFLIIASVMILSGCSKSESSSPNPVSGSRYRWDTDYPDIAEHIPSFDFNRLMFGDSSITGDEKRKILALTEKISKICKNQ